jgi:hypothetical protein
VDLPASAIGEYHQITLTGYHGSTFTASVQRPQLGGAMINNLVEARVLTMYDELRPQMAGFCGCEVCRGDVLVYALNRLTARYVATNEGKVMTELNLDSGQNRV